MKIIEAISDMNIGGAGVLLLNRLLSNEDMKTQTVVIVPKGSALTDRLKGINVKFIEVDACKNRSFEWSAIFKYVKLIKKIRPDIVNCHGMLSFRISAYLCRVPVRIYTRHCTYPLKTWQTSRIYRKIIGYFQAKLSNGIIAVANVVKDDLVYMGLPSEKITVIINGVCELRSYSFEEKKEIKKSLSIPTGATVVGIFARLEEYKGHNCFLDAAKILISKCNDYRFLIVGSGNCETTLKEKCKREGLSGHVIFVGFAEDVTPYFNVTDINVNCSIGTETSSLALSEGMSLSIPCVVSDYGGNVYMVRDGVNGLVYKKGDPKDLSHKIELLRTDKLLYNKMCNNARMRFEKELNANEMSEKTYALYDELMKINSLRH